MPQIIDTDTDAQRQSALASKFEGSAATTKEDTTTVNVENLDVVDTPPPPPPPEGADEETDVEDNQQTTTAAPATKPAAAFDVPEIPPVTQPSATHATIPQGARNYQDFPEEIVPVLRALNNTQFAKYAPVLKELHTRANAAKELETKIADLSKGPRYFYEHPEAYTLSPDYQKIAENLNYIQFEESHWASQLQSIKAGQPWLELIGYDGKTGQPQFKEHAAPADGKPDYAAEVKVQQLLAQTGQARVHFGNQMAQMRQNASAAAAQTKQEFADLEAQIFPKLRSETDMSAEDKANYALAKNAVPKYFQDHPLTGALGKAFVMYNRLAKAVVALAQDRDQWKAKATGRQKAEPAPRANGAAGKVSSANDVVDLRAYEND